MKLARKLPRRALLRLDRVDLNELGLVAERRAKAEAKVHRDADHECKVGAFEACAACSREEVWMVGR